MCGAPDATAIAIPLSRLGPARVADCQREKEIGIITDDGAWNHPSFTMRTHPGWLAEHEPDPTVPVWI